MRAKVLLCSGWRSLLDTQSASDKVSLLEDVGKSLLENLDYERYDRWNKSTLRILDLIFGQPSEPYMSFKFPGGGEAANSREGRVKNSISQKLKVLGHVQEDMISKALRPKFGWLNSVEEIEKALSGLDIS
jgi:hypothetical protein